MIKGFSLAKEAKTSFLKTDGGSFASAKQKVIGIQYIIAKR
jgi:hypothetical protein